MNLLSGDRYVWADNNSMLPNQFVCAGFVPLAVSRVRPEGTQQTWPLCSASVFVITTFHSAH